MGGKEASVTAVRRPELRHPNHPNHPRRELDPRCPVHPEWGCLSTLGRVANVPKQPLVAQEATGRGCLDFGVSRPR